jgi:hypothetical protein
MLSPLDKIGIIGMLAIGLAGDGWLQQGRWPAMPRQFLDEISDFERVERLCDEHICAVLLRLAIGAH